VTTDRPGPGKLTGMNSETIDVQTPDGTADCYLTRPSDDGPHPAVLLMIDAIGLRPRIEEMADRIARGGYVVLAPNVFYRVAALGGFHAGRMVTDDGSPHLRAPSVTAEVYWGHADEGATHGYTMSDMAVFDEAACELHFQALGALLGRTLATS
jgi:hypothetical protein